MLCGIVMPVVHKVFRYLDEGDGAMICGIIMLVLGVLFLLWQWWRPAQAPPRDEAKR